MICNYGCGLKASFQLKNKKWCCCKFPNQCPSVRKKNSNSLKNITKKRVRSGPGPMTGKIPWNKGLTKKDDIRIAIGTEKAKRTNKKNGPSFLGKKHSIETREKMSKTRTEMYINGWKATSCGRAKKYDYISPIAGKIKVDGKWELAVAKYLDSLNINWYRNTKRFSYINLKGKKSTYCPDFYIYDWNSYLEIKGYKTDLDKCKWSQFPKKLEIWTYNILLQKGLINKSGEMV